VVVVVSFASISLISHSLFSSIGLALTLERLAFPLARL